MSLRIQAEMDLGKILEDETTGFGWTIFVTDPDGLSDMFTGFSTDIAHAIDPDTGVLVSGRTASVAIRISLLTAKGFGLPEGISDTSRKPWIVDFNDINGTNYRFKVASSNPDRALGIVTCTLETYGEQLF